jgi:hypothetical protein
MTASVPHALDSMRQFAAAWIGHGKHGLAPYEARALLHLVDLPAELADRPWSTLQPHERMRILVAAHRAVVLGAACAVLLRAHEP